MYCRLKIKPRENNIFVNVATFKDHKNSLMFGAAVKEDFVSAVGLLLKV